MSETNTFTGAYIVGGERESILSTLQQNKQFQELIAAMKKVRNFNEKDITVRIAYKMKGVEVIKDKPTLIKTKFVQLLFDNYKAEVFYILADSKDKGEKVDLTGSIVHEQEEKITTFSNHHSEKLNQTTEEYDGQLKLPIEEDYPNLASYNHDEEPITPLAAFDACMPSPANGWYRHCGRGCGDDMSLGGGTPINPVDTCCRAHDRCWKTFGDWDCNCDKILINCTKQHRWRYPAAWATIYNVFAWNTISC